VVDDGSVDDGEWFRLRTPNLTVGRAQGDIILAHDSLISSQHLEISLRTVEGRYRVYLRDLDSRNGSFIRANRVFLRDGQELLLGSRRYAFSAGSTNTAETGSDTAEAGSTRGWQAGSPADMAKLLPALQETGTDEAEAKARFPLMNEDQLLGSDPQACAVVLTGDPFVSRVHARIHRDPRGRWAIENQKSMNGIWVRFSEIAIDTTGEVQIGEQRLLIKIP
jgi:pSer/pThr/pTyr-binding forkhead associated (FHA) protein